MAMSAIMFALPPKADICSATGDVRFVPIADMAITSLKYVICSSRQTSRHWNVEASGGFQIYYEFEFGRLHDR